MSILDTSPYSVYIIVILGLVLTLVINKYYTEISAYFEDYLVQDKNYDAKVCFILFLVCAILIVGVMLLYKQYLIREGLREFVRDSYDE